VTDGGRLSGERGTVLSVGHKQSRGESTQRNEPGCICESSPRRARPNVLLVPAKVRQELRKPSSVIDFRILNRQASLASNRRARSRRGWEIALAAAVLSPKNVRKSQRSAQKSPKKSDSASQPGSPNFTDVYTRL
jgi:hypothetical protein